MKKSAQTLTAICDLIAAGCLSQAEAARRCDVSVAAYWSWISQSQKGNPDFVITYCDEAMPFHEAVKLARKIALHDVLGKFEARMHAGTFEPVYFAGRPSFKELEACAGLDDETVKLLGYPDRYERDANGNRVQLMIHHEPPIAGVLKLLSANFPKIYGERSEINVNQKIALGVTTVARKPSPPVEILPPPPPPQMIERPIDGDFVEEQEEDLAELLDGPAPAPEPPADDIEAIAPSDAIEEAPADAEEQMVSEEPEPTSTEPDPVTPTATAAPEPAPTIATRWGSLTERQAEILNRLKAGIPATATTQPNWIVEKFTSTGDD